MLAANNRITTDCVGVIIKRDRLQCLCIAMSLAISMVDWHPCTIRLHWSRFYQKAKLPSRTLFQAPIDLLWMSEICKRRCLLRSIHLGVLYRHKSAQHTGCASGLHCKLQSSPALSSSTDRRTSFAQMTELAGTSVLAQPVQAKLARSALAEGMRRRTHRGKASEAADEIRRGHIDLTAATYLKR